MQGFTQESIREAIENARLPDSDLGYIQRFWVEESEKASDEAKALAKKQTAIREKVAENRKHRKVESTGSSAAQGPNPPNKDSEDDLRRQIRRLKEDLAKVAGNRGRGRGRGRGQSRGNSGDRASKNYRGQGSRRPGDTKATRCCYHRRTQQRYEAICSDSVRQMLESTM